MRNINLPGLIIVQHKGNSYVVFDDYLKQIDTGFVNTLLEKIAGLSIEQTAEFVASLQLKFMTTKYWYDLI